MTESQKIELRRSKVRQRLAEISKLSGDGYTDEVKTEESGLQDEYGDPRSPLPFRGDRRRQGARRREGRSG